MHDLDDGALNEYAAKLKTFARIAVGSLALLMVFAWAAPAQSQTLTFTPTTTTGAGSVTASLTWSTTPAATSCTASGHPSWTGTKAASGVVVLPTIATSGTYTLTLACTWPGDNSALVSWIPPTTNTDGSALAKCASATTTGPCLAKFQVYRATNSALNSPEMTPVDDPNATSYRFTNLSVNTQYFGVEAVNGDGIPAAMSNIASKVISSAQSVSRSVTIAVNPKPSPAVVSVQ